MHRQSRKAHFLVSLGTTSLHELLLQTMHIYRSKFDEEHKCTISCSLLGCCSGLAASRLRHEQLEFDVRSVVAHALRALKDIKDFFESLPEGN